MGERLELDAYARELVTEQSDTTYKFHIDGYSGMVIVNEWEPAVSGLEIYDAEAYHEITDWLYNTARARKIELTPDEVWRLIEHIGSLIRNPQP